MYGVYIEFLGKGETVLGEKYISFAILEREGCIRDKIKKPTKKKKKKKNNPLCFRSWYSTDRLFRRSRVGKTIKTEPPLSNDASSISAEDAGGKLVAL